MQYVVISKEEYIKQKDILVKHLSKEQGLFFRFKYFIGYELFFLVPIFKKMHIWFLVTKIFEKI